MLNEHAGHPEPGERPEPGGSADAADGARPGADPAAADPPERDGDAFEVVDGLTPTQERGVAALLVEPSIARAARTANVGERTLHTWMRQPKFMAAYRRLRRQAFSQAVGLTQRLAPVAVGTLAKIMADERVPSASRVAAAAALLRFGREALELDDLAERLSAVEAALPPGALPAAPARSAASRFEEDPP